MGRTAVALWRAVLWVHAALVVTQPIAAGAMLQASVVARAVHNGVGGVLLLVAMAQVPVAVLAWRPGHWPAWPIAASAVLLVAETAQLAFGHGGELAVHVPLGVAITAAAVGLALWSLRDRARMMGPPEVRDVRGGGRWGGLPARGARGATGPGPERQHPVRHVGARARGPR